MNVFLLTLLSIGCGRVGSECTSRRCLAQKLIDMGFLSQPQNENCTQIIKVPFMEYQTLSVDTKTLRLISRLQATIVWRDPELQWDTSVYRHDAVVLPVSKVWTPELHVTNGIITSMKHSSRDLLVFSNGTLMHTVIINAEVNCEVNLFNYPFAADECPVAIQSWSTNGCGTELVLGELWMVDSTHGDWQTEEVVLEKQRDDRNYILVRLSIKYLNPFITLLLPSILIILADTASFALPLGGGERNCFKITLVLSFTMFLLILNEQLPGDSHCSPIIRTHFCVCLILLVLSTLVSMVLTRVAKDGGNIFCGCLKESNLANAGKQEANDATEVKADISVVQLDSEDNQMLRKLVRFVENLNSMKLEAEKSQMLADRIDKIFFWFYFISAIAYFFGMIYVLVYHKCKVNHFDFWY